MHGIMGLFFLVHEKLRLWRCMVFTGRQRGLLQTSLQKLKLALINASSLANTSYNND